MFSINTVTSGIREKEQYYTEDESLAKSKERYYAVKADSIESQQLTITNQKKAAQLTEAKVYGRGAAELGLQGSISQKDFKSLFYGYQPDSTERIRGYKPNPDSQERLAEDVTFSAPKSVSITLHLGGDNRLFEAHTEAVREVLAEIERRYIQTRIQVNKKRQIVNTGNLIAAMIPHHTSRDGDMQLHTHAVIFNGTKGKDRVWRALHNDALSNQQWLGHLYQQKLAHKVQSLGYAIHSTKGGFELSGISQKAIQVFSKRSRSIVARLQTEGKQINHRNRDEAALTTRKAKNSSQTLEEYQQQWKTEAQTHDIKVPLPQSTPIVPQQFQTAVQALDRAISHLSERSVSFTRDDIYKYIYQSGIQTFKLSELDHQIKTNGQLIPLKQNQFTTVDALKREVATLKQWMKGQGKAVPFLAEPHLEQTKLNPGQKTAIWSTLTSTDTHQIIHGLSGVGKTTALGVLRNQLRETNVEIKGFAPTIEAASLLQEELDIETHTVARLVLSQPEQKPNQLWIIDEAGMMSASQAEIIVDKAELAGARILLVGDGRQNSSVEAGSPMRSLIDRGATTHSISQIIRQQNSTQRMYEKSKI